MWGITVLIICFELAIGFTGAIGLFDHMHYTQSQKSVEDTAAGYMTGEVSETGELIDAAKANSVDYFTIQASLLFSAVGILTSTASAVVFFLPHLRETFMFPIELAIPIQALIYLCYAWGLAQFLSGRGAGYFQ